MREELIRPMLSNIRLDPFRPGTPYPVMRLLQGQFVKNGEKFKKHYLIQCGYGSHNLCSKFADNYVL